MKDEIPTAEDFTIDNFYYDDGDTKEHIIHSLKEFAKLHVKAALKKASENATYSGGGSYKSNEGYLVDFPIIVNKESILNSYPDELIK